MICFLCLLLSAALSGCEAAPQPTESTVPTLSPAEYLDRLDRAISDLKKADNLLQSVSLSESKVIGTQVYTQTAEQTLSYQDIGTGKMKACLQKDVSYGSYSAAITEYFTGRQPYLSVSGRTFAGSENAGAFIEKQIPAVLFDPKHFSLTETEVGEEHITLFFSGAHALEAWIREEDAVLLSASASAKIDHAGSLLETTYQASYTVGEMEYTLEVRSGVSVPEQLDLSARIPAIPDDAVKLSCLDAPLLIMRAVGDILSTDSLYSNCTETIRSEAAFTTRVQDIRIISTGSEADYAAHADYSVQVTDYTGTSTTTVQSIRFANGICTSSTNGGEAVPLSLSAGELSAQCEDVFLMSMFAISYLEQAEMEDLGDAIHLRFTGTQAMSDMILGSIYQLLGVDLDAQASACSEEPVTGYLTISKHTGLPTASGMAIQRTHIIHDVSYQLTYQLDQTLYLPGSSTGS